MNALLAAGSSSAGPWMWLGGAVSVSVLITTVVKVGRWIATVEARLDRHDKALHRLGSAVAAQASDRKETS